MCKRIYVEENTRYSNFPYSVIRDGLIIAWFKDREEADAFAYQAKVAL